MCCWHGCVADKACPWGRSRLVLRCLGCSAHRSTTGRLLPACPRCSRAISVNGAWAGCGGGTGAGCRHPVHGGVQSHCGLQGCRCCSTRARAGAAQECADPLHTARQAGRLHHHRQVAVRDLHCGGGLRRSVLSCWCACLCSTSGTLSPHRTWLLCRPCMHHALLLTGHSCCQAQVASIAFRTWQRTCALQAALIAARVWLRSQHGDVCRQPPPLLAPAC